MPHKGYRLTEAHKQKIADSCQFLHNERRKIIRNERILHTLFSARQIINSSTRWRLMRKAAKKLYIKCKLCDSIEELECHHNPSLEEMIVEFLKSCNNICSEAELLSYDKFFDLQYIELLCRKCHKHNELHVGIHTHK